MKPEPPRDAADLARLLQLPADRELPGSRHRMPKEFLMQEIVHSTSQKTKTHGLPRRLAALDVPLAAAGVVPTVVAVNDASGTIGTPGAHGGTAGAHGFVYVETKAAFEQDTQSSSGYHAKLAQRDRERRPGR
jgi:hypothetical protein